jgi:glutaconyl-CoA/methylmalonyl-CoA decarboxylase subunit gamma
MKRHLRITVEGRTYDVVVEEVGDAAAVPVAIAPAPAPVPAPAAPPLVVASTAATAGAIVAPLGGTVLAIDVHVGRDVAVGDRVATIEAMKMKIEVISRIVGKVSSIAVKVNESVETGQLLMTLA